MTVDAVGNISVEQAVKEGLSYEEMLQLYRKMVRARRFEETVERLFLVEGMLIGPCHLYLGQEAVAVGSISTLKDGDVVITTYRGHGHAIARDVPMDRIMAELFGRATGTCKGIGGSMHAAMYPEGGLLYATAIVGSGIPIAAGVGLGFKYRKKDKIALCFFGDGATNTGAFHEGMNLASLWKLPVIYVCENNLYAMSTRAEKATAGESIVNRAQAYGMKALLVEGNDVLAVYKATKLAREHTSEGNGPTFIECRTYKHKGHGVYDKGDYRSREEVEKWLEKDPIARLRDELIGAGISSSRKLSQIDDEVEKEVEDAVKFSVESPQLRFDDLDEFMYA